MGTIDDYDHLGSVVKLVRQNTGDNNVEITAATTARDVKGWDSLAHIRIILDVEEQFGIRLRAGEVARLNCVGDLLDMIVIKKAR